MTRPAHRIRLFASRILSTGTMERLVDPILGDIEIERRESVRVGRPWRARWIVVSGYVGLCRALALHGVHEFARGATSDSDGARGVRLSIAAFVVVTLAMMLPPLLATRGPLKADRGMIAITLVPQAIPLSLPLAVAFGIAVAWPKRAIRRGLLRRALIFGSAGMVLSLATMQWLVPAGNRAFRELVFRQAADARVPTKSLHLPRGIGERSLSELATLVPLFSRGAVWSADDFVTIKELYAADPAFEPNQVALALQLRLAVSFATAVLCLLAGALASAIRGRILGRAVFVVVTVCYAVSFLEFSAMARIVPPAVAAWLPTVGLAVVSVALLRARPLTLSNSH